MSRNKHGPPGNSPGKQKASEVVGPAEAFYNHSLGKANSHTTQNNDTIKHWRVNQGTSVVAPHASKGHLRDQSTKPPDRLRQWVLLDKLKQSLASAGTSQPPLFDLSNPSPATPRQINYLISLYHRAGQTNFVRVKSNLGISHKVPDLTRREAAILIKTLKTAGYG